MTPELFAALLSAVCFVESGHNPHAINVSDGGSASYGYCQLKLSTARDMGFRGHVSELWHNREVNRKYASEYLRYQLKRYGGDVRKAVSAYNCGSACGNRRYVKKVMDIWTN